VDLMDTVRRPGNRRKEWDAMERWMDFIQKANPIFFVRRESVPNFADWLAPDQTHQQRPARHCLLGADRHMMSEDGHTRFGQRVRREAALSELVQNIRSGHIRRPTYGVTAKWRAVRRPPTW